MVFVWNILYLSSAVLKESFARYIKFRLDNIEEHLK